MDDIAHDVGMGKASLYYYFRTKESLFRAVILQERVGFVEQMNATLSSGGTATAKLHEYVERRFEYFNKLLNLNILDLHPSVKTKPAFFNMFEEFANEELKFLNRIITEGKAGGEFEVQSVEKTAETILHIMRGLRLRFIRSVKSVKGPRIEESDFKQLKEELCLATQIVLFGIRRRPQTLLRKRK